MATSAMRRYARQASSQARSQSLIVALVSLSVAFRCCLDLTQTQSRHGFVPSGLLIRAVSRGIRPVDYRYPKPERWTRILVPQTSELLQLRPGL